MPVELLKTQRNTNTLGLLYRAFGGRVGIILNPNWFQK